MILNGNPDPARCGWEDYLDSFSRKLSTEGTEVRRFDLRTMDVRYCTGCFSCWLKTPGLCVHKDAMTELYPEMIAADIIVWASPLILGNVSALTKKTQDRCIPLIHPYFELVRGEAHHRRRYPKNLDMGLIVEPGPDDTAEDVALVRRQHVRFALNGHGRLKLFATTATKAEEAVYETISA